jgi:hypothetical protein
MLLTRKGAEIKLHEAWPIYRRDHARANAAFEMASGQYDEVLVIEAIIDHRVWDRDALLTASE